MGGGGDGNGDMAMGIRVKASNLFSHAHHFSNPFNYSLCAGCYFNLEFLENFL
jgi:hypothetical protein